MSLSPTLGKNEKVEQYIKEDSQTQIQTQCGLSLERKIVRYQNVSLSPYIFDVILIL